jgi:hypothetical protein
MHSKSCSHISQIDKKANNWRKEEVNKAFILLLLVLPPFFIRTMPFKAKRIRL